MERRCRISDRPLRKEDSQNGIVPPFGAAGLWGRTLEKTSGGGDRWDLRNYSDRLETNRMAIERDELRSLKWSRAKKWFIPFTVMSGCVLLGWGLQLLF